MRRQERERQRIRELGARRGRDRSKKNIENRGGNKESERIEELRNMGREATEILKRQSGLKHGT